jgi:hypothetical protein
MNIAPLVRISKQEFDACSPDRNQSAMFYIEERDWFKTSDGKFVASIEKAISCDDWSISVYEVASSQPAQERSIGCDESFEVEIIESLVLAVKALYKNEEEK